MESTAQYWRPVWEALERRLAAAASAGARRGPRAGALHLAQAQSNQGAARPEAGFSRCRTVGETAWSRRS